MKELPLLFLRLGATAFGGPAVWNVHPAWIVLGSAAAGWLASLVRL